MTRWATLVLGWVGWMSFASAAQDGVKIDGAGVDSAPDVFPDGRFNYLTALQKSLFFYEAQRSGKLPSSNRVKWRGDSALEDGKAEGVDLSGGYYDAGDHVKFGLPMAGTLTLLAWGGVEYGATYEAAGLKPRLLEAIRWGTDFLLKAHTAPNELWGQVGKGDDDHKWWGPAEVLPMKRPAFKIDASCPGSELAGESAAALAAASILFRPTDPTYADRLQEHAQQLYDFAAKHRGKYHECIKDAGKFYKSFSGFQDELAWAAVWLHLATGNPDYLARAEREAAEAKADWVWTHSWDDKIYGTALLLARLTGKEVYRKQTERWLDHWTTGYQGKKLKTTPGGLAYLDRWGVLRYAANASFLAFLYSDHLKKQNLDPARAATYHGFALRQMRYILGDNPLKRSFVVGFGNNPPQNPHHRTAHGSWNANMNDPRHTRHVLYGALVGGPELTEKYSDNRHHYVSTEVALDYNAGFTGALARLLQEFGGVADSTFPRPEKQEDELFVTAQAVGSGAYFTEISATLHNQTGWPARTARSVSARYFVDLTEVLEKGYRPEEVEVHNFFSQGGKVSPMVAWDRARNLYYTEITFPDEELCPCGFKQSKRQIQFRLALPWRGAGKGAVWSAANDPSFQGLKADTPEKAPSIPVYENGKLVFGKEPARAGSSKG